MMNRILNKRLAWAVAALAVCMPLPPLWAADTPAADADADQPEHGIRFTPEMARVFAGVYTREVLKGRYEMPEDKMADAQEKVARRLMQLAHKIDEPGRELIERFAEEQLLNQASGGDQGFMPAGFGKEFAERLLPIIPDIRDLARGVAQDVRPMLPMKKQLQMAGEMMAFKTGVDGFEATMKKWASGEDTTYDNPFFPKRTPLKKDENGETEGLKQARSGADKAFKNARADGWAKYVEEFTRFYGLDSAQAATAQSMLREFTNREKSLMADTVWQQAIYRCRFWAHFEWQLSESWSHPVRKLLEDQENDATASWDDLEEQLKTRLESIPTTSQRRAAEEKIKKMLADKGLKTAETQP